MRIEARRVYCFREYPDDSRPWASVVSAEVGGKAIKGVFPPCEGMPGAETAAEATRLAVENLVSKIGNSGLSDAIEVRVVDANRSV